jgi:ferredoxin
MQICPDIFGLDDNEGRAVIIDSGKTEDELELVKEAIDNCPIGCINE